MSAIGGKNTRPEIRLRRSLHRAGYRFRLHTTALPGRPDVVLPKYRTVIFVHGCFWHRHQGCSLAYNPKSRASFWRQKFALNVARDRRQITEILRAGWKVIVVWECVLRDEVKERAALRVMDRTLRTAGRAYVEIPRVKSTERL